MKGQVMVGSDSSPWLISCDQGALYPLAERGPGTCPRTGNHPNLLVTADGEGFTIRVMDHEGIFYGNNPERPLPHLTLEDSILTHPALRNLLGRNFKRNTNLVQQAVGNFYLWASACEQRTDEILSLLPADWRIDVATFRPLVQQRLFAQDRLRAVEHHFHELLQQC
ncbi:MAG: hypothetical protein JSU02_03810 [Bacteroidetes bacterium]|nr:hypothetical protein [Bacteroidota bacterium]